MADVTPRHAPRVSVAVMAHPRRAKLVDDLVVDLRSTDVEPQVVWDRQNVEWDTGRRALMAFDRRASHHLIVQDDALVCRDLVRAAGRVALAAGPDRPVSLYTGRVRPFRGLVADAWAEARAAGATALELPGPWWGVALMVPTAHILDLVAWADRRGGHIREYDKRLARWYARAGVAWWHTVPSLVDHRPDEPSLLPGHVGTRTAHEFIGCESSGLEVEWQGSAFRPTPKRAGDRVRLKGSR